MKRLEQRERENLARIFYTIIQTNSPFLDSLSINFGKTLVITINQVASIKTPLPVYNVGVMVDWNIVVVGEASITVNKWSSRYEINKFKMEGGLKRIREVMELIKAH